MMAQYFKSKIIIISFLHKPNEGVLGIKQDCFIGLAKKNSIEN